MIIETRKIILSTTLAINTFFIDLLFSCCSSYYKMGWNPFWSRNFIFTRKLVVPWKIGVNEYENMYTFRNYFTPYDSQSSWIWTVFSSWEVPGEVSKSDVMNLVRFEFDLLISMFDIFYSLKVTWNCALQLLLCLCSVINQH